MTIAFDAWKDGHVAPSRHEVGVVAPKAGPRLEAVSGRLKRELIHPNRTSLLVGLRFSPDGGRVVAGDYPGGVVVVWDLTSGEQQRVIETGYGYRGSYEYFFLSPDWHSLFVGREKRHYERVERDGKRLIRWDYDGDVRCWDLATGRLQRTFKHQPGRNVRHMQLAPDGAHFVTLEQLPGTYEKGPPSAVSLWDVATGRHRPLSPDCRGGIGRFSADGRVLAIEVAGKDDYARAVRLIDVATGAERLSIPVRDKNTSAYACAFSPDGRLLAGDCRVFAQAKKWDHWQGWLKWWDTATGQEVVSFPADKDDMLWHHRFSRDGRTFALTNWRGKQAKLLLFSVPHRRLDRTVVLGQTVKGERFVTSEPAFSPDGRWLAITTQTLPDKRGADLDVRDLPQPRIHLIDVAAGVERETLVSPQGFSHGACCFSPDGKTLATAGLGRILLWDMSRPPGAAVGGRASLP
jgi:WD40 repeat protein